MGSVLHRVVSALLQLQGQGLGDDDDDSADASSNQVHRQHLPVVLQKMASRAVTICDPGMRTVAIILSCFLFSLAKFVFLCTSDFFLE